MQTITQKLYLPKLLKDTNTSGLVEVVDKATKFHFLDGFTCDISKLGATKNMLEACLDNYRKLALKHNALVFYAYDKVSGQRVIDLVAVV